MIIIAVCLWDANKHSMPFSRHYTSEDVDKLYRGFARNLTVPFRFVCFTERPRVFAEDVEQERLSASEPNYGSLTEPYRLNEPMILCGLDTVVVGNCDHLAAYCLGADKIAVPRDPFQTETVCNGVALVPGGQRWVWDDWRGQNDMEWIRSHSSRMAVLDDVFPGAVVSYKGHTEKVGLEDATRIVYFHGLKKPHELMHVGWIDRHWTQNVREAA